MSENISAGLLASGYALPSSLLSIADFKTFFAASPSDGKDVVHEPQIMRWSQNARILHEMSYTNGSLVIQREGYYYVYSKVSFKDTGVFHHSICRRTDLYTKKYFTLLTSRKYSVRTSTSQERSSNSYLAGVFHLKVGDNVHVQVSNTSKLLRHMAQEHIFGAFML